MVRVSISAGAAVVVAVVADVVEYNIYIVTGPAAHSSFQVQGEAGDCQGETVTRKSTIVSMSLLHVVCLSMILALCVESLQSLGIKKQKQKRC